ncbi:hypothetical protein CQW23_34409 [Capsicum baccatum]|uniref:Uncharacterized protein n=1 Tax=Capsicum baccatum TaxID=33114 RepID=A0A2G2UYY7_CAPBA|nr:hypothetical protein CQW23_34409 [Capsicum baccatum]
MEVEQLVGAVVSVFAGYDGGGSPERGGCMAAWVASVGCFVFVDGMPEWWTAAENGEVEVKISNPKRLEVHLGLVLKVDIQKVSGYSNKIHVLLMTPKCFIDIPISSYFIVMATNDNRFPIQTDAKMYAYFNLIIRRFTMQMDAQSPTTSRQGKVLPSSLTIRMFAKRGSGKKNFMDLRKSLHGHNKKVHPKKSGSDLSRDLSVPVLIRTIRRSTKEKVQMASEVSSMLQNQVAERASAKEEANILQAELDSRTRRLETEKNELQLVLEKELDRRSNDWSLKLEKYQIEQHRLRERAREIAEQNVSLQR